MPERTYAGWRFVTFFTFLVFAAATILNLVVAFLSSGWGSIACAVVAVLAALTSWWAFGAWQGFRELMDLERG